MVNRDQVAGLAKQMKGSVKQAAGKATGNRRTQVEGAADKIAGKVQKEPARRLPNLARVPIVVVTAEASWMAADNHAMVDFLAQAGCQVEHLRLEDKGVHGNGHAMQLESNSDEVAAVIEGWLLGRGLKKKPLASGVD